MQYLLLGVLLVLKIKISKVSHWQGKQEGIQEPDLLCVNKMLSTFWGSPDKTSCAMLMMYRHTTASMME